MADCRMHAMTESCHPELTGGRYDAANDVQSPTPGKRHSPASGFVRHLRLGIHEWLFVAVPLCKMPSHPASRLCEQERERIARPILDAPNVRAGVDEVAYAEDISTFDAPLATSEGIATQDEALALRSGNAEQRDVAMAESSKHDIARTDLARHRNDAGGRVRRDRGIHAAAFLAHPHRCRRIHCTLEGDIEHQHICGCLCA